MRFALDMSESTHEWLDEWWCLPTTMNKFCVPSQQTLGERKLETKHSKKRETVVQRATVQNTEWANDLEKSFFFFFCWKSFSNVGWRRNSQFFSRRHLSISTFVVFIVVDGIDFTNINKNDYRIASFESSILIGFIASHLQLKSKQSSMISWVIFRFLLLRFGWTFFFIYFRPNDVFDTFSVSTLDLACRWFFGLCMASLSHSANERETELSVNTTCSNSHGNLIVINLHQIKLVGKSELKTRWNFPPENWQILALGKHKLFRIE